MNEKKPTESYSFFDDKDAISASERHSRIMAEGDAIFKVIKRLFYGCLMIIVVIVGFLIFMYNSRSEFWRYP